MTAQESILRDALVRLVGTDDPNELQGRLQDLMMARQMSCRGNADTWDQQIRAILALQETHPTSTSPARPRKIIQIATNAMPGSHHADTGGHGPSVELYALCDDGSLWKADIEADPDRKNHVRDCWRRMHPIPQEKP